MANVFCNEKLAPPHAHSVRTDRGKYLMGNSWIDTTAPRDMMGNPSRNHCEWLDEAAETHRLWCQQQVAMCGRSIDLAKV
jgi:hypothetical protein